MRAAAALLVLAEVAASAVSGAQPKASPTPPSQSGRSDAPVSEPVQLGENANPPAEENSTPPESSPGDAASPTGSDPAKAPGGAAVPPTSNADSTPLSETSSGSPDAAAAGKGDRTPTAGAPSGAEADGIGSFANSSLDEEEQAEDIPPARDTRGGHFLAAAGAALWVPMGRIESGVPMADLFGPSLALTLTLGFGVSRTTVAGLWGHFAPLSSASDCSKCDGQYFAGGPFVRYHLAQGIRTDPWISLGVGVRSLSVEQDGQSSQYLGLDWLRLRFGGDFYPTSNFGFGPFIEWNLGNPITKSEGKLDGRVYAQFLVGGEFAFDVPGR